MSSTPPDQMMAGLAGGEVDALLRGDHRQPHDLLGPHATADGIVVRTFMPEAVAAEVVVDNRRRIPMQRVADPGLFAALLPRGRAPLRYQLSFRYPDGATWDTDDPYRFDPTVGEMDRHLFNEGTHRRLWNVLGAQVRVVDGVEGTAFAVWAPNARAVSLVGDFNRWDGRRNPMRLLDTSGIFELFAPGVGAGARYKYELHTADGSLRVKTDPYARAMEEAPGTASRVVASTYAWHDDAWMDQRPGLDHARRPMTIYEVHLGSWARIPEDGDRSLTYREIAVRLVEHVARLGFTHVELMPIAEHPFTGSWGYQVTGYFAPTARYGTPDDFRFFVDCCHRAGIGVILDWVPAHFPKDDYALRRFDGTALYEHDDPRRAEHPDWGTLIFNYGRNEVRNFLIANALYWLREFHVDGLRVDAVASMLYLDYSRKAGEWVPNRQGGREDLEAVAFLQAMNDAVRQDAPGCFTVAEESTAWPNVTRSPAEGGLGFTFKWNMGWMHDTLAYFHTDPLFRRYHHDRLTFAMIYEYSEQFVMPLSHDEVVHGKGSLINKMPGDHWQQFANLRVLLAYQYTRPGKQLLFMGTELASTREWNHDTSLDWHLAADPLRAGLDRFLVRLGGLYRGEPDFWRGDPDPDAFQWIECCDRERSVMSYLRRWDGSHHVVILNLTPIPQPAYRVGVPAAATYQTVLSSDDAEFGGSHLPATAGAAAEAMPWQGQPHSVVLDLPPLAALVLAVART